MLQVKAYYSSAIRGPAGDQATAIEMETNLSAACLQATELQQIFGNLLDIYCPHQHDRLIQILWKQGHIATGPILQADLLIQNDCDITIVNNTISSYGVDLEIQNARFHRQPCILIGNTLTDWDILEITRSIQQILIRKMEYVEASKTSFESNSRTTS